MFENFQLAAIVNRGSAARLLEIPLNGILQNTLAQNWYDQHAAFVMDVHEIGFDAGYQPEGNERFCLQDYELPDWLAKEDSQSVRSLDTIVHDDAILDTAKGIVAFVQNDRGEELLLFQNFNRSHVVRPGSLMFLLHSGMYETSQRAAITLDSKLSAIFLPAENKLLFQNFRTVNTFLPLAEFYKEASEHEIRQVLNHNLLSAENAETLATNPNQWFRKRFAMLRDSKILNEYTAQQIADRSKGHNVDIQLDGDRIIFPADRIKAKRLLQFLNEELFRGPITETLYETNSKREAD